VIVGGDVFAGAAGAAATTSVCEDVAELAPTELVPVTFTRSVDPTSGEVSV
jgi:hypothetical protein